MWVPEVGEIDRPLGVIDGKLIMRQEIDPYTIAEGQEDPHEKYPITDDMSVEEMNEAMRKRDEMYQKIAAAKTPIRKIYAVDLATRQCTDVFSFDKDADTYRFVVGENRIWWITETGAVGWVTMDGTTGTLDLQWPEGLEQAYAGNGSDPEDQFTIKPERITQGKMVFSMSLPMKEIPFLGRVCPGDERYAVDLESGVVTPLPQNFIWDGFACPVTLWAETPEGFLLNYTMDRTKQVVQGPGGSVEDYGYRPRLGIATYEDFFAGKKNWDEIRIDCDLNNSPLFLEHNM